MISNRNKVQKYSIVYQILNLPNSTSVILTSQGFNKVVLMLLALNHFWRDFGGQIFIGGFSVIIELATREFNLLFTKKDYLKEKRDEVSNLFLPFFSHFPCSEE